jgi:opacity protein-like surface antigen
MRRAVLILATLCAAPVLPAPLAAAERVANGREGAAAESGAALPLFARAPDAVSRSPQDVWKGFSYGVEAIAVGGKGIKGGFGGAANVAWTRPLDNGVSVGLKAGAGYRPGIWRASPWAAMGATGANFAFAEANVAYEFGRVRPWASVGAGVLKPTRHGGFSGGLNALNGLFEPGHRSGYVEVGAGVDYAVTNNLTIGVAVRGFQAQ